MQAEHSWRLLTRLHTGAARQWLPRYVSISSVPTPDNRLFEAAAITKKRPLGPPFPKIVP